MLLVCVSRCRASRRRGAGGGGGRRGAAAGRRPPLLLLRCRLGDLPGHEVSRLTESQLAAACQQTSSAGAAGCPDARASPVELSGAQEFERCIEQGELCCPGPRDLDERLHRCLSICQHFAQLWRSQTRSHGRCRAALRRRRHAFAENKAACISSLLSSSTAPMGSLQRQQ